MLAENEKLKSKMEGLQVQVEKLSREVGSKATNEWEDARTMSLSDETPFGQNMSIE